MYSICNTPRMCSLTNREGFSICCSSYVDASVQFFKLCIYYFTILFFKNNKKGAS